MDEEAISDIFVLGELSAFAALVLIILLACAGGEMRERARTLRRCLLLSLLMGAGCLASEFGTLLERPQLGFVGLTAMISLGELCVGQIAASLAQRAGLTRLLQPRLALAVCFQALVLGNAWHALLFEVVPDGPLVRGPLFFLAPAMILCYAAFFAVLTFLPHSGECPNPDEEAVLIETVCPLLICAALVAEMLSGLPVALIGTALAFAVFYLALQEIMIFFDPVTCLHNRRAMRLFLLRQGAPAFVILVRVKGLPEVSQNFGRTESLSVARRISALLFPDGHPPHWFVVRLGRGEFVIIGNPEDDEGMGPATGLVRAAIERAVEGPLAPYELSFGVGSAALPAGQTLDGAIRIIDGIYLVRLGRLAEGE
ncbi:MAG: hypothetical protein K6A65_06190 [Succinivibrionaceae bacterium]|nr:hypothetical protein [Succinivibrionaceae bacterium]